MTDTPQVEMLTRAKAVVEREAQAVGALVEECGRIVTLKS